MNFFILMLGVMGASMSSTFVRCSTAPAIVLVLYRVTFATLLLTPYVIWHHQNEVKGLKKIDWLLCILAGVFLGLHFICYFESLRRTAIASAAVLVNTEALFVTIGMALFMKAKFNRKVWGTVLLAFAGSVIVAMADAGSGSPALLGNLLALAGAIFGAIYTILGTSCRRSGISTMVYSYFLYATATLTVLGFVLVSETVLFGYEPINFLTTLGMAICCTIGGHTIYSWSLKYFSSSFVASTKMMEPVLASLWGILLFGELPNILVVLGGTLVILSIISYGKFLGE